LLFLACIGEYKQFNQGGEKMSYVEIEQLWEKVVEYGIATEKELRLVSNINGYNIDSLNSVIYARTGYRNIEQIDDASN